VAFCSVAGIKCWSHVVTTVWFAVFLKCTDERHNLLAPSFGFVVHNVEKGVKTDVAS